jgi:hypothetical protein
VAKSKIFKNKIVKVIAGWTLYESWNWILDTPVWIYVCALLGVLIGSFVMTALAFVNNYIFLFFYNRNNSDWLGEDVFEVLKDKADKLIKWINNHSNQFVRIILWTPNLPFRFLFWAIQKNDVLAFIALSCLTDSFVTTTFLRTDVGNKLTRRDHLIFVSSTALSCFYWSLRNGVILAIIKGGWEVTKQFLN